VIKDTEVLPASSRSALQELTRLMATAMRRAEIVLEEDCVIMEWVFVTVSLDSLELSVNIKQL